MKKSIANSPRMHSQSCANSCAITSDFLLLAYKRVWMGGGGGGGGGGSGIHYSLKV